MAASNGIFAKLQSEYPDMRAYLVLAHRCRQTELTSNPIRILEDGESMIVSDDIKREALRLLLEKRRMESAAASEKAIQPVIKALAAWGRDLRFVPEIQIAIQFHVLRYALGGALQSNPSVDRELTPQTRASMRIMIGILDHLSRTVRTPESSTT